MAVEKESKNLTVFGQETEFEGVLEFSDELIITGKFKGTIRATGELEIDKSAVCDVDTIDASSIVISGKVNGNLNASERVEICAGSKVKGDIKTARIRIDDDVEFEGQVTMLDTVPDVDLFSVASSEYKQTLIVKTDEPK